MTSSRFSGVQNTSHQSRASSNSYQADPNEEKYRRACRLLEEKCREIEKDNEKLSFRLDEVKKMTKRRNRDVTLLKNRLDTYGDDWRTAGPMQ